jgi:hypothetical protein
MLIDFGTKLKINFSFQNILMTFYDKILQLNLDYLKIVIL